MFLHFRFVLNTKLRNLKITFVLKTSPRLLILTDSNKSMNDKTLATIAMNYKTFSKSNTGAILDAAFSDLWSSTATKFTTRS